MNEDTHESAVAPDPPGTGSKPASMPGDAEIIDLLRKASGGDQEAFGRLYVILDPVTKRIARKIKVKFQGVDVRTTQLVGDALMNVTGRRIPWEPEDVRRFYDLLAFKMHDLLIDQLRSMKPGLHNPGAPVVSLDSIDGSEPRVTLGGQLSFLLDLKDRLARLQSAEGQAAVVFRLKFLLNCTFEEIAMLMGTNQAAAYRQYVVATDWLKEDLADDYEWAIGTF